MADSPLTLPTLPRNVHRAVASSDAPYRGRLLNAIRAEVTDAFRPTDTLPLSDFIEQNLWLEQGQSAQPGPVELWPFQREIADSISHSNVERITVLKGTRLGFTTLLNGAILHFIRQRPTSIIFACPTDDDIKTAVVALETTVAASPKLTGILPMPHAGRHGDRDTIKFRHGPGWSLRFLSTRSPRNMRTVAAEVIIADEISAYTPTDEGAAVPLLANRSMTFPRRKLIIGSSPGTLPDCYVSAAWEEGDQRIYRVPCLHCGHFAEITWESIVWPTGKPLEAGYVCGSCGSFHNNDRKAEMVAEGHWHPLQPEMSDSHRSYRMSCLIAPHLPAAWPQLASEFLIAKRTPENLKVFVTTILGQAWRTDEDDGPQPHELAEMAQPISLDRIPEQVLFLCSGADIQGDRIEVSTWGFDEADTWFVLDHRIIPGSPLRDECWSDLLDFLKEEYPHPLGKMLKRDCVCVDASDGNTTNRVLDFCNANRHYLRTIPIKGAQGSRPALAPTASKRSKNLMICGVDPLKTRLYDRIAKRTGIVFSSDLPMAYYEQLTSEHPVIRYQRGQPHRIFARYPGAKAESLDCGIYALAARSVVNTNVVRRSEELKGHPVAPVMPVVIRSAWLDKGRHY